MADHVVRLVNEIDWRRGLDSTRQAEREYNASTGRMVGASQKVDQAAASTGQAWQRGAQLGQKAMTAMSAAIGASTAAAAAGERQWLALGTVILGSFAAGGPIAGGIALIGASIGIMTGEAGKAERQFLANAQAAGKWAVALGQVKGEALAAALEMGRRGLPERSFMTEFLDLGKRAERLAGISHANVDPALHAAAVAESEKMAQAMAAEAIAFGKATDAGTHFTEMLDLLNDRINRGLLDEDMGTQVADELDRALTLAQTQAEHARSDGLLHMLDANASLAMGLGGGQNRANELALENQIRDARVQIERNLRTISAEDLAAQEEAVLILEERLEITRALNDEQVNRLNHGVEREIELLRARNDVEREMIRLRHRSEDLVDQGASPEVVNRLNAAVMASIASRPWQRLLDSADQTLGQGLSDIIYDGITNGFRSASDIAEQIWQALLHNLINQFVSSGFQGLFSSGGGGGGGGLFGIFGSILGGLFGGGGGGSGGSIVYGSGSGGGLDLGGSLGGGSLGDIGGDPMWESNPGFGMAAGGIVTRPSFKLIGERGPEAVVPLHRMNQMGGGGVNVGLTVNVGGGGAGDYEATKAAILAEVARSMDENATFRNAIKRNARRGL